MGEFLIIDLEVAGYPDLDNLARQLEVGHQSCERSGCCFRMVADQIREQAKPPEPQGLGAVVEDADEVRWLCNRFDPSIPWSKPWFSSDLDEWRDFTDIAAVRVLSEGVVA